MKKESIREVKANIKRLEGQLIPILNNYKQLTKAINELNGLISDQYIKLIKLQSK